MDEQLKKKILQEADFHCEKCGYYSPLGKGLQINKNFKKVLCNICNSFAPNEAIKFQEYLSEKIDWQDLETFRKFNQQDINNQLNGMINKAKEGRIVARPPYGYKVINGILVPDEKNAQNIKLIFEDFANGLSLNQLAKKYDLSVNGIKKILKNFAYLGKIKFNSQILQGEHQAIISNELFNRAQKRFEFNSKKQEFKTSNN